MKAKEILKLKEMLANADVVFNFGRVDFGYMLMYPDTTNCRCNVIERYGSYGYKKDLLEIRGLLTPEEAKQDDVVGFLTAEDVFKRISDDWEKIKAGYKSPY